MKHLSRALVPGLFAVFAVVATERPIGASSQVRPLYVSVTDSKGAPKAGVTASDLVIEVNGKSVAGARVAPAQEPVSIVVVTEGIRADAISEIRKMMKAVVTGAKAIHPDSRVGLMIQDGAAMPKMHEVTSEVEALDAEIARFFESSRNAPLLDSIVTASQVLSFEKNARRIIVAVTRAQEDTQADVMSPVKVSLAVRGSGASLWALDLGGREEPTGAAEQRVLSEVTAISGGRQERTTVASITPLTERIMATLRGQYAIYLEDGVAPKAASPKVSARTKDVRVLAAAWPAIK
ncbi:MAG: hypothetical protein ABIP90_07310 [Vicinamibacterales bacterium]